MQSLTFNLQSSQPWVASSESKYSLDGTDLVIKNMQRDDEGSYLCKVEKMMMMMMVTMMVMLMVNVMMTMVMVIKNMQRDDEGSYLCKVLKSIYH